MSLRQRIVLILGFMVVFGMALLPPWRSTTEWGEATAGYRLVFWPSNGHAIIRIDTARFGLQIIAVLALTGAIYLILRPNQK